MSDAKHTAEPWVAVVDPCDYHQKSTLADAHGNIIAQFGGTGPHVANTARAEACVNACAGMADPAAEIERLRKAVEAADLLADAVEFANVGAVASDGEFKGSVIPALNAYWKERAS